MNANTLGTIGALVAFAGTILAMSSGTKLVGIVLLGTALTMGVVGLAQVRSEPRRQHHPTPGRAPRLAVVLALVGIGVNSIPSVQAALAEIESHEITDEQWRQLQKDLSGHRRLTRQN
ncbi:hypothetical protein HMPREF3151_03495 [Corynebacterium sp. HMSC05H05]|uniref:hypothetical protein n=1 Tax=Corynebacterium sp. HMSC05H05 TaxID=1581119 RepID=UPI0008A4F029|nr:hypothetical protein [Corynebacterium sp. HMSC05H05]OFT58748.1 hypothetical protein HMPREF3151_03495 [Corynebacterium sp. HMSC05H05]